MKKIILICLSVITLVEAHSQEFFALNHNLDKERHLLIAYKGYESSQKPSEVSGHPRLFYDQNKPFTKEVKFFNQYKVGISIDINLNS